MMRMRCSWSIRSAPATLVALFGVGLCGYSSAQVPYQTVQWSAELVTRNSVLKRDDTATVKSSAEVLDGWHVYAAEQLPDGPTPLRVSLDDDAVAQVSGALSGTAPESQYDASFGLVTHFYTHSFTLYLPVRLKARSVVGSQSIPLSVRFQTCNGQVCQPPKTVRLSAQIEPPPGA
jgi:hypothetical protein